MGSQIIDMNCGHKDRSYSFACISLDQQTNPFQCSACILKFSQLNTFISIEDVILSSQKQPIQNWPLGIKKVDFDQLQKICKSSKYERLLLQVENYYKEFQAKMIKLIEESRQQSLKELKRNRDIQNDIFRFYNQKFKVDQLVEIFTNKNGINPNTFNNLLIELSQSKDKDLKELQLKMKEEDNINISEQSSNIINEIEKQIKNIKLFSNSEIQVNQNQYNKVSRKILSRQSLNEYFKRDQSQNHRKQQIIQQFIEIQKQLDSFKSNFHQNDRYDRFSEKNYKQQIRNQTWVRADSIKPRNSTYDPNLKKINDFQQKQNSLISQGQQLQKAIKYKNSTIKLLKRILLNLPNHIFKLNMIKFRAKLQFHNQQNKIQMNLIPSNINTQNQQQSLAESIIVQKKELENEMQDDEIQSKINYIIDNYQSFMNDDDNFQKLEYEKSLKIKFAAMREKLLLYKI